MHNIIHSAENCQYFIDAKSNHGSPVHSVLVENVSQFQAFAKEISYFPVNIITKEVENY